MVVVGLHSVVVKSRQEDKKRPVGCWTRVGMLSNLEEVREVGRLRRRNNRDVRLLVWE